MDRSLERRGGAISQDREWSPPVTPGKRPMARPANLAAGTTPQQGDPIAQQEQQLVQAMGPLREYEVQSGDSGARIADRLGLHLRYIELCNPGVNLGRLQIGQILMLPRDGFNLAEAAIDPMDMGELPSLDAYTPGAPETIALFREAARAAGLPESWAESDALHWLLDKESKGVVGQPNYSYGARHDDPEQFDDVRQELLEGRMRARSSATGLGQLILDNTDLYYPSGRHGIGHPLEEAIGMLRYIEDRFGTPQRARERYGQSGEGY